MRKQLNLNVGCGNTRWENCINIDMSVCSMTDPDIQASAIRLPFKKESFDKVFLFQMIEHIERRYMEVLLHGIWRILKEDGKVIITCPDGLEVMQRFIDNKFGKRWDTYQKMLYGRQLYKGDYHQNIIESQDLTDKLFNCGFKDLDVVRKGVDLLVLAHKGEKLARYLGE